MSPGQLRWVLFRSLSTLLASGVPLVRALECLSAQFTPSIRAGLEKVSQDLLQGRPISVAMSRNLSWIPLYQLGLIRVGETSGQLVHIVERLARHEEHQERLRQRISSQLTYPLVLLFFASACFLILPPLALRGIVAALVQSEISLPFFSKLLIWLSSPAIAGLAIFSVVGLAWNLRKAGPKWKNHRVLLRVAYRLPALNGLLKLIGQCRFCEALSLQLHAGVALTEALPLAASVTGMSTWVEEAPIVLEAVLDGAPLAQACRGFSRADAWMISTLEAGEASGKLPQLLERYVQLLSDHLEYSLEALVSLLEPLVLVLLGGLFAFLALATLLPLTKLVESL